MREPGDLGRNVTGFGAALATAAGLIALLPRHEAARGTSQDTAWGKSGRRSRARRATEGADPGAEGPAERHLPVAKRETRDVAFWQLATGGLCVLAFVGLGAGVAHWLYPAPDKALAFQQPAFYPMPALQNDTVADMNRFRTEQLQQLNGIYWIDKAAGTVHLPIKDAMRIVAREGIADWPKTPYPPVVPAR